MRSKHLLLMLLLALMAPWAAMAQTRDVATVDFETGNISGLSALGAVSNDESFPWIVSDAKNYTNEGTYCIKSTNNASGNGDANTTSSIEVTVNYSEAGTVKFFYFASCESSSSYWDFGAFYIDGTRQDRYLTTTSWTEKTYNVAIGSHVFKWTYERDGSGGGGDNCLYIDDITFTGCAIPTCPGPSGLAIAEGYPTANEVSFTWDYETGEVFQYALPNGNVTNPGDVNFNTTWYAGEDFPTWDDLTPLTTRTFWLRKKCGDTDFSDPVFITFTTIAQVTPVGDNWSDNFEGESCGWQLINGDRTDNWCWGTATNNGGTHALYISDDNGTSNHYSQNYVKVFAAKLLGFGQNSKYTFTYDWKCKGESSCDFLRVALVPASQTLSAGNDYSTIGSSSLPSGWIALDGGGKLHLNETWQNKEVTINVTAGNYYMVFIWRSDSSTQNNPPAAVDNVSITRVTCPYDVTGLEVEDAPTAHEATINWTAGDASQWEVAWSKDNNFAAANTQTDIVSSATKALTGLDASSTYYVKVRAYCGGEDFGAWCDAIDFDTECEAISTFPWSENFDEITAGNNVLPNCWRYINTTTNTTYDKYPKVYNYSSHSTSNCLYLYSYAYYSSGTTTYDPQPQYAILPEMTGLDGKQIVLWAKGSYASSTFKIGTMSDPANASTFTEIAPEQELTTSYQQFTYDINNPEGAYLAIMIDAASLTRTTNGVYIDDIVIRQQPDCATPTGLAVTANSQTPEGATITWTAGDATSWIVEYKKSTEETWTAIGEPVNSATYTFTGLDPETIYNVRVKVNCTTGEGITYPTEPTSFTTQMACPAPKNLVVSGVTATQAVLSWTAGYNETEWTVKYKKHADTEYTTAPAVNTTPAITLEGLTDATVYDVQIIGCDATHIYSVSNAFTTAFAAPFNEAFAESSIPTGWDNYSVLLDNNVLNGTTPLSGSGSWGFYNTYVFGAYHPTLNIYGENCKSWLVTPNITIGNGMSLDFDLALTDYGNANGLDDPEDQIDDKFIVLISTDNAHTWSVLRRWDNTGSEYVYNEIATAGEPVYLDLAAYSGQTVRIAFYGESTVSNGDNDMHIDNVRINTTPACFRPSGAKASHVTNHSVTLSWKVGEAGQNAWQVAYKKGATFNPNDPELDWTTITTATANDNSFTINGTLDFGSTYYLYVRANCGGSYSEWCHTACSFTTLGEKPAPTALTKKDVGPDYVDLYWTPGGGDNETWEVYCTDNTSFNISNYESGATTVDVAPTAESPFTISGLTNETNYIVWVRSCYGNNVYSTWISTTFKTLANCPKPTNLAAANITHTTADLTWTGYSDSYTVEYQTAAYEENIFFDGFENGFDDQGWTIYTEGDAISGNAGWVIYDGSAHSGNNCASAWSYYTSNLDADNWLITPQVDLQGTLKFWEKAYSGSWPDAFEVKLSTTGKAIADFTVTLREMQASSSNWNEVVIDLSSYSGQGYIAIHHVDMGQYALFIDDFGIYGNEIPAGGWDEATTTATDGAYPLEGLAPGKKYDVRVKGNCGGEYSDVYSFTTIDNNTKIFKTAGDWNVAGNWDDGIPTIANNAIIRANATVPADYDATANSITFEGTTTPTLTIKDGGQLHTNATVTATFEKEIVGYTGTKDNYYLICPPNDWYYSVNPTGITGMLTGDYDLYAFDGTQEGAEWRNYEASAFNMEIGKGFLYANAANVTLSYTGIMYRQLIGGNYDYLYWDADTQVHEYLNYNTTTLFGTFNLVGNTLPHNAYVYVGTEETTGFTQVQTYYYKMNDEHNEVVVSNNEVKPWEGVFVQATAAEQYAIITSDNLGNPALTESLSMSLSQNNSLTDVAIVNFGKGNNLGKFQLNPNHTKLYIPQDNKDYAVVYSQEKSGEMPVSFKAEKNGSYTLSFSNENVEFGYLHLIDNMTGEDVNLLETPSYSFEAKTTDYASRFKLVFSTGNGVNEESFAFISDGNIILNGEGMLQVVDVMGRIMMQEENATSVSTSGMTPGVYVLRLINGDSVKTQKIVIK